MYDINSRVGAGCDLPPDVRRGLSPRFGLSPYEGRSPENKLEVATAGQSPASHPAAEP